MIKDITRFCLSAIIFLLIFTIVYLSKCYRDVKDGGYQLLLPGSEIYKAQKKSKQKTEKKKLIIGDSTGNQFFSVFKEEDSIHSLACNQAIGMCGHFFLLDNYLTSGARPQQVYLVFNRFSLNNNLDQVYTFHYFLKPFYTDEYKKRMSKTVIEQIKKVPYHSLSQFPRIKVSTWAPDYRPKKEYQLMSPISNEYLLKIDSLRHIYRFELYLIPSLIPKSKEMQAKSFCQDRNEIDKRLQPCIKNFIDSITYVDDTCFFDGVHLKHPQLYKHIIEAKMEEDGYLFRSR